MASSRCYAMQLMAVERFMVNWQSGEMKRRQDGMVEG